MFDWLGFRKGLPLWWSYRLNRHRKSDVEQVFEGFADTRKHLLISWTEEYWGHLDRLSFHLKDKLSASDTAPFRQHLTTTYTRAVDCSEIFVLAPDGRVISSTYPAHVGVFHDDTSPIAAGLAYARQRGGQKCLFGPYPDPQTLAIGPRSSAFHDKMTVMFILPLVEDGAYCGAICGRVPNDVLGDLIQRESGHVYPDSGDNYLFMAKPQLQTHIVPGTALSRSRFEDHTFTHGENLKDGVTTDWGVVSVKEHTELEILFTDPATGELHPGVANTIRNGSNLFVEFPGYSDYRHIPVIGKGVTFQLPHCPDVWGMMCEGDLEEVYRLRSIRWQTLKMNLLLLVTLSLLGGLLVYLLAAQLSPLLLALSTVGLLLAAGGVGIAIIQSRGSGRVVAQLDELHRFIRINAEGQGDLTQRLSTRNYGNDEIRELAKWINNMIDSLEGIMLQVKLAAKDVMSSQHELNETTDMTAGSTERVSQRVHDMIRSIRRQLKDIDHAKEAADQMRETLRVLEQQASEQIAMAQGEVERIGGKMGQISSKVEETNGTIRAFMDTTQEIRSVLGVIEQISAQTHLLALNASIEAARVGEHGRGFAVVASEIRKLADMTRTSTEEVHGIVQNIHANAQQAFASMEEGTLVVSEGTALVSAASEMLASAKEEDLQKNQVIDQVVLLMEKIAAVSMENRTISTEVEGKVQELISEFAGVRDTSNHVEAITAFLQQLVSQFQLTEARRR
ncbi:methyl-accepting chemotaxis protein [Paenibacillus sp. 598K]|uniref:methyl-accepting chemotaxis protein n=1 Tax=Paenibacillus sp. 598K TaxID=1117987 RepID=UPI000FF947AB|nr:methyl-accepting chemotaxis protein [Paenibacillus sp. 598K]GBF74599.1 methyl-accepting chemotaxis protein [Paenibacillus sp. 598K]